MFIQILPNQKNTTPDVVRALDTIKAAGGGEIHFEKGEYHFFKEGTRKEFIAVSNNSACNKYMAFPILEMENIIIDGHDSVFVFHDVVFPFMVSHSKNIAIRNIIIDTGKSPLVEFRIHDLSDEGFYMDIDREASPFFAEDGSLCFQRESEIVSGKNEFFSLHALGRHQVQYFATGDCKADMNNLPAPLMKCDVRETATGIYARYRADSPSHCVYGEETVTAIVDGKRKVDVICLDRSEDIKISNITVARGIGMGIIGQLSSNIRIDGFSTDISYHPGGYQTLTADALHFVNCDGVLEIKNCTISDTMDDAINVHGNYTVVKGTQGDVIYSSIKQREHIYFNPYRPGDRLEVINNTTFEIVAEFFVESSQFEEGSNKELIIKGRFSYGADRLKEGFWIENPDRMPDLHIHHNRFCNYPHNRISGGGEILVEENYFADCQTAMFCMDLAPYWYESGRIKHLVFRNNILKNCNSQRSPAFLQIGVDGVPNEIAPKIHKKIEIIGNQFLEIKNHAVKVGGVQELVVKNNVFDSENEQLIVI